MGFMGNWLSGVRENSDALKAALGHHKKINIRKVRDSYPGIAPGDLWRKSFNLGVHVNWGPLRIPQWTQNLERK
jgi:hypothetical protein